MAPALNLVGTASIAGIRGSDGIANQGDVELGWDSFFSPPPPPAAISYFRSQCDCIGKFPWFAVQMTAPVTAVGASPLWQQQV